MRRSRSADSTRRSRPASAPFAATLLVLGLGLALVLARGIEIDPDGAALATCGLLAVVVAWNVWQVGVPVTAPSMLFLAALTVFHLGMVVPIALGLAEPPLWLQAADPVLVGRAVVCVALAIVAYELGCLKGWRQVATRRPATARRGPVAAAPPASPSRAPNAPERGRSALHSGGWIVAAVATAAIVVNVASIGVGRFFSASYGYELYAATDSRLLLTALYWLLPAAALVTLVGARPGRETRRALALVSVVAVLLLWAGDRGGAVSFTSAALIVWTTTYGPLPRKLVVPGAITMLLLMPMVATLRQLPRNGLDLEKIVEAATEASPIGALTEMGGSLRTLVETVRLVPDVTAYRLGGSYVDAAVRVVPNIGLSKAETDWTDPATLPPNHWITYMVAPWAYAAFGGLGFSAVAEPFLNFGIAGVAGYFFVLGALLGWLDMALTRRPSRRFLAITAVVFMPLLVTVRNDFHNFLRPAAWGAAIVFVVEQVHGDRRARSSTTRRRMLVPRPIVRAEAT